MYLILLNTIYEGNDEVADGVHKLVVADIKPF